MTLKPFSNQSSLGVPSPSAGPRLCGWGKGRNEAGPQKPRGPDGQGGEGLGAWAAPCWGSPGLPESGAAGEASRHLHGLEKWLFSSGSGKHQCFKTQHSCSGVGSLNICPSLATTEELIMCFPKCFRRDQTFLKTLIWVLNDCTEIMQ